MLIHQRGPTNHSSTVGHFLMLPVNKQKTVNNHNQLLHKYGLSFDNRYIEHKSFYMQLHNRIPNLNYLSPLEGEKAFQSFKERFAGIILNIYTYHWYDQQKKAYQFCRTVVQLKMDISIEFGEDYCEILHDGQQDDLVKDLTSHCIKFKERRKRAPQEINLITRCDGDLELKTMQIKRCKLDIDLYYEDDFKAVDTLIQQRLKARNDKGIVLLHGLPGTGKTTYLRYLAARIKKQVLFLSPSIAGNLMDPGFIQLLINNPNSVLIIEDAEEILMDRRTTSSSSVSNLLNISDGLLADFLNVQLICTFNSPLTMVDSALTRKGRLIAKYEFGKLGVSKGQRLSDHCGFKKRILEPMTLAEIIHQNERGNASKEYAPIGFRTGALINN